MFQFSIFSFYLLGTRSENQEQKGLNFTIYISPIQKMYLTKKVPNIEILKSYFMICWRKVA